MIPAIERLRDGGGLDDVRVNRFLEEYGFPIVEGRRVTFVYRGEASAVRLRHWIYGLPSSLDFARLDGTDLWYLSIELPEGSRIEYKLEVDATGERSLITDPLNPRIAHEPTGSWSVCHASGYETPEWANPDDKARPGALEQISIPGEASDREISVYLPARFRRMRRYPLLVVHDGGEYLRYAALQTVLDNLIYRLEIPPMIVALTSSEDAGEEHAGPSPHSRWVTEHLLPSLERRYPLMDESSNRGLMGASFGAVAALSTAWRHPGRFGRLLLQSGSFAFTDIGEQRRGPDFEPVVRFVNAFRENPGRPSEKIFLSCGIYESLIYENRSMVPLLQSTGMEIRYVESRDGHNWESWRDRLREGLSWLYPGPLWMVYE